MAKPYSVGSTMLSGNTDGRANHVVQFYDAADDLIDGVGAYVSGALSVDDVAIVVATGEHRAQLDRLLVERGVDVVAARADGLLVECDAEELLARFAGPDGLSRADFEAATIELIAPAAREGRAVRIFGEIVAVLWNRGLVAQA